MATNIGALEFDVILKNGDIEKQAKQTKDIILGIADTTKSLSEAVDNNFIHINGSISDTNTAAEGLNTTIDTVTNTAAKAGKINFKDWGVAGLAKEFEEISNKQAAMFANIDAEIANNRESIQQLTQEIESLTQSGNADKAQLTALQERIRYQQLLNEQLEISKKEIAESNTQKWLQLVNAEMERLERLGQENTETYRTLAAQVNAIKPTQSAVSNVDLDDVKKQLQNVSAIQSEALKGLDKVYKENTLHIKALNDEIQRINTTDDGAAEKIANLQAEIAARQDLNKEIETQRKEIEGETITQQLRLIQREMQNLAAAGQEDTDMYRELLQEAGRLKDIRGDVAAQTEILANDDAKIKATTVALGGVNSALSTAQSGMQLMGASTGELTKAMTTLNSVTNIANGLAAVSATLNKDSYARRMANIAATKLQTVVTNLLGKAHLSEAAAAKVATVATAAATAGLTLLIPILYNIISKFRELNQAKEDINKGMADAGAPAIITIEKLSKKWNELGDNLQDKSRFIDENKSEFEKLGASINSVNDAEKLLNDGKNKFIKALMDKAKATAAYNVLVEKQKELIDAQLTYGGKKDENGKYTGDTGIHFWTEVDVPTDAFYEDKRQEGNLKYLNKVQQEYDELKGKMMYIISDAQSEIEQAAGEFGSIMVSDEDKNYVAEMKKKKAIFDNYQAALLSENQAVKTFFTSKLKDLQGEVGKSVTTWREYLSMLTKDPKNKNNAYIMNAIYGELLNDKSDPLKDLMERQKKNYADYSKLSNSTSKDIRDNAQTVYASLLKQGANYEEFLNNLKDKYKGNAQAIKKINMEIIETQREGLMDLFKTDLDKNMLFARDIADQLKVIEEARAAIADDDPQKKEKNDYLNDKAKNILGTSNSDLANAQKAYQDYLDGLLPETERIQRQIQKIRLQYEKETDEKSKEILYNEMQAAEIRLQMAQNKEKINNAKEMAAQLVRIEEKRAADIAAIEADESLTAGDKQKQIEQIEEFAKADIDILKGQFTSVDQNFVDEILKATKEATAGQLQLFVDMINDIQSQLATMEANGAQDSEAYIVLKSKLDMAKSAYEQFKTKATKSTKDLAKDKSLKEISTRLSDLGATLQGIGGMFEGVIGEVMDTTGQMLTTANTIITSITTLSTLSSKEIEGVSKAAATAIRTVEAASVILAIIEAAMQVAMSLINLFQKDEETYEDRKNVYQAYIKTVDEVIDREKALMDTMTDTQDIMKGTAKVAEMYAKQEEQTRRIADEYLHEGTKGKKNNRGTKRGTAMGEKMTSQDFADLRAAGIYTINNATQVKDRLMDLNGEQIRAMKEQAVGFYSKLDDETRGFLDTIEDLWEQTNNLEQEEAERITGISFDDMKDNFKSTLLDMNATAEDLGATISDTIREKLITNMVEDELNADLKKVYDYYKNAMGDNTIDETEIRKINQLKDDAAQKALKRRKEIDKVLGQDTQDEIENSLSGAIKGASQESIDLLAGQTNAVRMNQVEQINLVKQQLTGIMSINQSVINNGKILTDILTEIRSTQPANLRGQGIEI